MAPDNPASPVDDEPAPSMTSAPVSANVGPSPAGPNRGPDPEPLHGPKSNGGQPDRAQSHGPTQAKGEKPPWSPPPAKSKGRTLWAAMPNFGRGIWNDVQARAPWYASDWRDAYNYRVVPAVVLIFFANVLPGIAFSLDLIETTNRYGVAEVLLSSFMAAFVFSVFGAQPLCVAGVTGPITVLNKTIFDITQRGPEADRPDYLQFIGWVYLWGAILHWITAVLNWCNFLQHVTLFSCDAFGFYVSWVYLQYGVQVTTRQFQEATTPTAPYVGLILALLMLVTSFLFQALSRTDFFHRHVRRLLADYGMPVSLIATSAMAYWGRFNNANPATLPINGAFEPANDRPWLVRFWELDGKWVGIAFPFGVALWVLFFFDHNVSSLMAQGSQFPLRKPAGFHYDFFLLGVTTFIAGLLGVPAPNGLIPQAPIHTQSLVVMGHAKKIDEEQPAAKRSGQTTAVASGHATPNPLGAPSTPLPQRAATVGAPEVAADTAPVNGNANGNANVSTHRTDVQFEPLSRTGSIFHDKEPPIDPERAVPRDEVPVKVVEQRVSNLAQGTLCLILLTGPFLHVLHLIPRGVLAGLFWYMGVDALRDNGITQKIFFFFRDAQLLSPTDPLKRVRKSRIAMFVGVQLVGFAATFAITQTIAAIGFPIVIFLLVPTRMYLIPRLPFTAEELSILDGPTASPFTMESVGGNRS